MSIIYARDKGRDLTQFFDKLPYTSISAFTCLI